MLSILFSATYAVINQVLDMEGIYVERAAPVLLPGGTQAIIEIIADASMIPALRSLGGVNVVENEVDYALKYDNPTPVVLSESFGLTAV